MNKWATLALASAGCGIGATLLALTGGAATAGPTKRDGSPAARAEAGVADDLEQHVRALRARLARLERAFSDQSGPDQGGAEQPGQEEGVHQQPPPERTLAQEQERIDQHFSLVSEDFGSEPVEADALAEQEELQRAVDTALPGVSPRVECRSTLCRVEIQRPDADEDFDLSKLYDAGRFRDGGMAQKLEDGRVVLFAGRPGYPFQELHASN